MILSNGVLQNQMSRRKLASPGQENNNSSNKNSFFLNNTNNPSTQNFNNTSQNFNDNDNQKLDFITPLVQHLDLIGIRCRNYEILIG